MLTVDVSTAITAFAAGGLVAALSPWWITYPQPDDRPRLGVPTWWILPVATAVVVAGVGAVLGICANTAPVLIVAVAAPLLAWVDIDVHRLPNRFLGPLTCVIGLLEVGLTIANHTPGQLLRAVVCAAGSAAVFFVLAIAARDSIGLGDVKLATPIGLATGWVSWYAAATTPIAGILLSGVVAAVLLIAGWDRKAHIPLGPMLLAGALVAALVT